LSLADLLHLQYCELRRGRNEEEKSERDKNIPPQLLGNQHLALAALNPVEAVALLCDRLRIYKAWADTARPEAKLAKWAVGRMGEVALGLTERLPERAMTDMEKAELLLGYLARETKSQEDEGKTKGEAA